LALDGVAPRAKMNQQRTRRFCSAREFEEQEEAMKQLNMAVDREATWDHNQITPGTPFMSRLAISLRKYVKQKQETNIHWKNILVIIDDSSNPGEGEHKIMDYIRRWRVSANYNPNITHAVCGQDADLIHLGLALHEPKVFILRDRVEVMKKGGGGGGGKGRKNNEITSTSKGMDFLSIERLRQYLFYDFYKSFQSEEMLFYNSQFNLQQNNQNQNLNEQDQPFIFNIENVIDDFIFICFFVGNDFLPHLPSLSIRDGSLDLLIKIYCLSLSQLKGYINNEGIINLKRVEILISKFGLLEKTILKKKSLDDEKSKRRDQFKNGAFQKRGSTTKKNNSSSLAASSNVDGAPGASGRGDPAQSNNNNNHDEVDVDLKLKLEQLVLAKSEALVSKHTFPTLDVDRPDYMHQYYKQKILDDENYHQHGAADEDGEDEDVVVTEGTSGGGGGDSDGFVNVVSSKVKRQNKKNNLKLRIDDLVHNMKSEYMKGLCWVALYYAQKVPSWTWFYPYHYAPFATDLNQLMTLYPIQFELGKPFSPLTQLMAVLPARSAHCVPPAYRPLMEDPDSCLASNYNLDFELDPNNKPAAMRWLWVAKLPFLNTELLLTELSKLNSQLSNEEKIRNSFHEVEIMFHESHSINRSIRSSSTTKTTTTTTPISDLASSSTVEGGRAEEADDDTLTKELPNENNKEWNSIIGQDIDGFVHIPKSLKNDAPSIIHRYQYRFSRYQINKSIVHQTFMVQTPPLIWSVLQYSLPRKEPRLPISEDQLYYIVHYQPTEDQSTISGIFSSNQSSNHAYPQGSGGGVYSHAGTSGGGGYGGNSVLPTSNNDGRNYHQGGKGNRNRNSQKSTELCRFLNTPNGCTWGANCRFSHSVE
jgi:5'-3' exoribonuclease 2